jgi:hypothetical protein
MLGILGPFFEICVCSVKVMLYDSVKVNWTKNYITIII